MWLLWTGAGIAILVVMLVALERSERRRRAAIGELAQRLDLAFSPDMDDAVGRPYEFLQTLFGGFDRYGFNVCSGIHAGHPVRYFDFQYRTFGGKQSTSHYLSIVVLEHDLSFPRLEIGPRKIEHAVLRALDLDTIRLESEEFNAAYFVASNDRRFASDFCHPRMMAALLSMTPVHIEIENGYIAAWAQPRMPVERIQLVLDDLVRIRELIPAHICTDWASNS